MSLTVVVVQHGEKVRRPGDPGLTEVGRRQAAETAAWLADQEPPSALYGSPMRRAIETARPIAARLGLTLSIDKRVRERMNWESGGQETFEAFREQWAHATADREFEPTSGDSSRVAGDRFLAFLDELAKRHADTAVAVVAHGGVTVDLLRTLVGDDELLAQAPTVIDQGIPGCGLTRLSLEGNAWSLYSVGATAHLTSAVDHRPV